jgi:hypothetical protein
VGQRLVTIGSFTRAVVPDFYQNKEQRKLAGSSFCRQPNELKRFTRRSLVTRFEMKANGPDQAAHDRIRRNSVVSGTAMAYQAQQWRTRHSNVVSGATMTYQVQ